MRYAVTADLHGRRKAWRRFRDGAAGVGADRLIVLGDYLEAEVSRRRHDPARRWSLEQVVKPDPELWAELAAQAELVLGNQELRIRDLLRPEQVPAELAPLLAAPEVTRFGAALGMHGHQLHWRPASGRPPEARAPGAGSGAGVPDADDYLEPDPAGLPEADLVVAGHTHQTALLEVTWPSGDRLRVNGRTRRLPVRPGSPVRVELPGSAGVATEVTGSNGVADRMLFVNVGPARGRPTHWFAYDDDLSEITFWETGR
jgi:predicted phosphodiesterase